jgi:diguanylate cyclase (GGDEF)-like protein
MHTTAAALMRRQTKANSHAASAVTTALVVDDSRTNCRHLADLLETADVCSQTVFAADGLQAIKVLHAMPIDLVICDLTMPRCDGFTFLRLKAVEPAFEHIPVVVVTGSEASTRKVQALSAGASDYIVKPFDDSELLARISVHMKLRRAQQQLMAANEELRRIALLDPLTQLANRRGLDESMSREFERARRYGRPLAFALLDLDHFKVVNDTHGHAAGDAVLTHVASVLVSTLRSHDTVARFGGEEFAMILPETGHERAASALERMRRVIESSAVVHGGVSIAVAASIGIATVAHPGVRTPDDLIRLADAALYEAKQAGRNRVVCSPLSSAVRN